MKCALQSYHFLPNRYLEIRVVSLSCFGVRINTSFNFNLKTKSKLLYITESMMSMGPWIVFFMHFSCMFVESLGSELDVFFLVNPSLVSSIHNIKIPWPSFQVNLQSLTQSTRVSMQLFTKVGKIVY